MLPSDRGLGFLKDIAMGLSWLLNRRHILRAEILKNEIGPTYEAMKENHDDFRSILERMENGLLRTEKRCRIGGNDLSGAFDELLQLIDNLKEMRNSKRSDRPALQAQASRYRENISKKINSKRTILSPTEISEIETLFQNIEIYLTNDIGVFGHDLYHYFATCYDVVERIQADGATDERMQEIVDLRLRVRQYATEREDIWQKIASEFGKIKAEIRT